MLSHLPYLAPSDPAGLPWQGCSLNLLCRRAGFSAGMAAGGKKQGTILVEHSRETERVLNLRSCRRANFPRQSFITCKGGNMPGQLRHVTGRIQKTVLASLDHFGGTADSGQNDRQSHGHRFERRI